MKLKKFYLDSSKIKYFFNIILILVFIIAFNESKADSLLDSLQSAYLKNSKLNAERANMRASREEKREAISEFLPSVTISGYRSSQDNIKGNNADTYLKPKEQSLLIEQKIFQGFSGVANLQKKRIMSYNKVKRFIMFYERITLQMIKDLSKSASIVMSLKKNHEIKKVLFRSL